MPDPVVTLAVVQLAGWFIQATAGKLGGELGKELVTLSLAKTRLKN